MSHPVKSPRKLIEVALPLDAINAAAAAEKQPGIGAHPRGLHLWWARRPLAAARAVIFSQLVNDPSWKWELEYPGEIPPGNLKASWAASRKRLFKIIEELVLWKNTTNQTVLEKAHAEIRKSWQETCELNKDHPQAGELFDPDKLPGLHDPFAGGGAIPLEAQRLGLEAYASDLNPVAVLINKAMIEIPPRFAGRAPVGPLPPTEKTKKLDLPTSWPGATGLAEDVRRYGAWMRAEAEKRIGHLYPKVQVIREKDGTYRHATPEELATGNSKLETLTVIAWLWARTVKSPNPAFSHVDVPLASTFILSSKAGKEAYVEPIVDGDHYHFEVRSKGSLSFQSSSFTAAKEGTVSRAGAICAISKSPIPFKYLRSEAKEGRFGTKLMAVVAEGTKGRVYLSPTPDIEGLAASAEETRFCDTLICHWPGRTNVVEYGMTKFLDLFTPRQLVALTTFSDLVGEAREKIRQDAAAFNCSDDDHPLDQGGKGARAYAEAVSVYLAFAIDRLADYNSSIATWKPSGEQVMQTFKRQALPMTWDFPESNILGDKAICWKTAIKYSSENLAAIVGNLNLVDGHVSQEDAQLQSISAGRFVSTDPPYYDNIGYADLSDYFYVWLRKSLRETFPSLLATIAVPKAEELVATPYRHGTKQRAEEHFLTGMTAAMKRLANQAHLSTPLTVYYAFKQSETTSESGTASTGWETFLDAINRAGLQLSGTWPMRTELANKVGMGANMLASSIVLVCRKRPDDAPTVSRREFQRELNRVLPEALDEMTRGSGDEQSPVAPVDLSQAIIGPGMAIFSRYAAVLEADGTPMTVRTALQLINRFLAEDDFDADTQFCLHWFDQHGWEDGAFGDADVLSRSKATSVNGIAEAGVIESGGGKVRLLKWADYPADWDPSKDHRKPVWESLHQLIRAHRQGGDSSAGALLAHLKPQAEAIRQLAYRLYTLCERKRWAEDARAYNELITSWPAIESASSDHATRQRELFD